MKEKLERTVDPSASVEMQGRMDQMLSFAFANGFSVAVWRLPSDGKIRMILDTSGKVNQVKVDLEELNEGFVFAPFRYSETSGAYFIQKDIFFQEGTEISYSDKLEYTFKNNLEQSIKQWVKHPYEKPAINTSTVKPESISKDDFCGLVQKAVNTFDLDRFQKVVLSRSKKVKLTSSFNLANLFLELCKAYPNAFVSIASIPEVGTWIGASPEVLISVDKNKIFRTAAVAGTQLYNPQIKLSEVGWRQKDIEEQAMVSRYIINCFKKIRLREFDEIGPRTARAGNLVHLKTDFVVDTNAVNLPQLGSVMIELLHPTSAVCGTPKDLAMSFILKNEHYDRSFYSGFLGPVNLDGESHLYVNIRSMQIFEKEAALYAGAGVTHESVPEKEWEETEIKMNTLLELLRKLGVVK